MLIPQHLYQLASIFGLVKHFYLLNPHSQNNENMAPHMAPQPVLCLTPPGKWQDTTKHLLNKLNFQTANGD